jgi:hypothetical protein
VTDIPIQLVVEDVLSEEVLRRLLRETKRPFSLGAVYGKTGSGFIRARIDKYNQAARTSPFLILTDLDRTECPPSLIAEWFEHEIHANLIFRVAVREVEAWLMADRRAFARLLGIAQNLVPAFPDRVKDPKQRLIALARKSPKARIKSAIVPEPGLTMPIGPGYNTTLAEFVRTRWSPEHARKCSNSLQRAIDAMEHFTPQHT